MLKNEKDVYGMIWRKLQGISEKNPGVEWQVLSAFVSFVNAEAASGKTPLKAGQRAASRGG